MRNSKLEFVDALRGIAVLLVFLVHSSQYVDGLPGVLDKLLAQGSRGVLLFYIASAFTLFLSLSSKKNEGMQSYFTRRFFRIAPLYFLALFVYLVVNGLGSRFWLGDAEGVSAANIISHLFFVNGFNPYWINSIIGVEWSIAVEMLFYLFVPFLFVKIKNLQQATIFLLIAAAINFVLKVVFSNVVLISDPTLWNNFLNLWFPEQLPIFALGFVFFFLWRDKQDFISRSGKDKLMLIVSLVLCVGLSVLNHSLSFLFGVVFLAFSYYLSSAQPKLFVNKLFEFFGKISYSVYLTHYLIIQFVSKLVADQFNANPILQLAAVLIISLALTVITSMLTYKYIEIPGMAIGKAIINKRIQTTKGNKLTENIQVTPKQNVM